MLEEYYPFKFKIYKKMSMLPRDWCRCCSRCSRPSFPELNRILTHTENADGGDLMMLPSDIALIEDADFKKWVEVFFSRTYTHIPHVSHTHTIQNHIT